MRHLHRPRVLRCVALPAAFCIICVLLAGCANSYEVNAFEGGNRPADQIARLNIDTPVRLVSLDGKAVSGIPAEFANGQAVHKARIVRILPGPHRLVVGAAPHSGETLPAAGPPNNAPLELSFSWSYRGSAEDEVLDFTAVAGRRYIVKVKDVPNLYDQSSQWKARVIDSDDPHFQKEVSTSAGRVPHDSRGP